MTSELAAPMYVRVPPGVERLQVQCAGSIFLSSLDLKAPPGLLWSPGQLLKAIISGSGYSNGMTQAAPLNHVADVQKTTPLLDEAPLNHVADVQMTSPLVDDMKLAGRPDAAPDNLPSVPVPRAETAEFEDRIGLEAALVPALRDALAKDRRVSDRCWRACWRILHSPVVDARGRAICHHRTPRFLRMCPRIFPDHSGENRREELIGGMGGGRLPTLAEGST
eukprot:TRINITY_DN9222_c0_g1_i3.p1 TRINITY_DN9222_c0_g1~~TRINITY_DN9222_c0_g1_i3.p1  ORF type:complete len:222 (+),score=40.06 TRINITY_DN9222_c0_g1_i3:73-738(+)